MVKVFKSRKGQKLLIESYDQLLKLWGVQLIETDVKTRYGTTHIILCGDEKNPPLLMFHGVGDNSALMWVFNASELSKHFYLIAVDTLGGPGKSIPNESYQKGFSQVFWIDDILESLSIGAVNIVGVSNGAYLSQLYTAKRPEKVISAICMSGAISVPSSDKFALLKTFKVFLPEALFPTDKNIKKLLTKLCGVNIDVFLKNKDLMIHWKYLLKYNNPMAMTFHKVEPLSKDEILILSQKALFIVGNCDPIIPASALRLFEDNSIKYIVIDGAGHGINHEFSENVNKIICEFLSNKKVLCNFQ